MMDKTCLSYWFPKLEVAGVPVPKTILVDGKDAVIGICEAYDGNDPGPAFQHLVEAVTKAAEEIGYPIFLRTGQTSAKHNWNRTCFVQNEDEIPQHIFAIAEYSEMCSLIGLPYTVWAVREFLPTEPFGVCEAYHDMPVCREFRAFIKDGNQICRHPYWPLEALQKGGFVPDHGHSTEGAYELLCHIRDGEEFDRIVCKVGEAIDDAWSVDLLDTANGWYVTDMAEAEKSFHWPACPNIGIVEG